MSESYATAYLSVKSHGEYEIKRNMTRSVCWNLSRIIKRKKTPGERNRREFTVRNVRPEVNIGRHEPTAIAGLTVAALPDTE